MRPPPPQKATGQSAGQLQWRHRPFAPLSAGIVVAQREQATVQYTIFLAIFLAFLGAEALDDWVLRIPFRENPDWRLLVPYVALYVSSVAGLGVMR